MGGVYQYTETAGVKLIKDLRPWHEHGTTTEYLDRSENIEARSARVYIFNCPNGHGISSPRLPKSHRREMSANSAQKRLFNHDPV